jgi:hypothetical protein
MRTDSPARDELARNFITSLQASVFWKRAFECSDWTEFLP